MTNYEAVFLRLDERQPPESLFFRFIGVDAAGETEDFLTRFGERAAADGLCFSAPIPAPSESELKRLLAATGEFSRVTEQAISEHTAAWLTQLWQSQQTETAKALWTLVKFLKGRGMREETLRRVYTDLLCLLSAPCGRVLRATGGGKAPKIMYEGEITANELYLLYTLALAGCDVVYAHHNEESYLAADPIARFSTLIRGSVFTPRPAAQNRAAPPPAPTGLTGPPPAPAETATARANAARTAGLVHTNSWITGDDILSAALDGAGRRGGAGPERRNVFFLCFGADEREVYRNRLFLLREKLRASGRKWIIMTLRLPPPSEEETAVFRGARTAEELAARLTLADELQTLLARRALLALLDERAAAGADSAAGETGKADEAADSAAGAAETGLEADYAPRLAAWLARYAAALTAGEAADAPPLFLYYGSITPDEIDLLWLLKETGADVLYFSPDKADKEVFRRRRPATGALETELPDSLPWEPFPEEETRLRAQTTAYNASRELDRVLYSDTGFFRRRQFARCRPVTLNTTYDEIPLLWPVEAKYRPNFLAEDGVAVVPNIFAKICGVEKGLAELYWDQIAALTTEQTFLAQRLPFFPRAGAPEMETARQFWREGRLAPEVKKSPYYRYEHLPRELQDLWLEKTEELLRGDTLSLTGEEKFQALAVLLALEQEILRLIQNFDYTGAVPKLIFVSATDSVFSLEDCVYAAFLNMLGFDVLVFTPTGNRDIEAYIDPRHFDTHQIGEFMPDLKPPDLRRRRQNLRSRSWLGKLFGGRDD
ncbi:MAG: YceG family protein [Gracilibacteraceae bacterium]|jgi:hypothetical protein|nr:YceG family protein [Gracilibacteraceae bacterium]